ncbi:MAG: hypothetical protein HY293_17950, partial [Planctomycetes bacterium]|nr:hypothetical protein [Planctomycetota bacterium]
MHPIWKPLAILSLSLAALLAGMTLWLSLRENPMAARMRRNVEEQVRFHLEQKEPEKAAAVLEASKADLHDPFLENRLRIEVARASEPEQAAKILDGLIPPAMDREQAADVAQTRLDLQRRLFDE